MKSNKYFEFEEIIDLTNYVVDVNLLIKYGKEIEKKIAERKLLKKKTESEKLKNQFSYMDSSFKFFPPVKITRNFDEVSNSSYSSNNTSKSKNISENLKNRFSFLEEYVENTKNIFIKPKKILYKLHSIIIHSGLLFIIISNNVYEYIR
jgi:hypothetical protein